MGLHTAAGQGIRLAEAVSAVVQDIGLAGAGHTRLAREEEHHNPAVAAAHTVLAAAVRSLPGRAVGLRTGLAEAVRNHLDRGAELHIDQEAGHRNRQGGQRGGSSSRPCCHTKSRWRQEAT